MNYVIGIDGGTESIRAGVYDRQGSPLAFHANPYPTDFPKPSWAEQHPEDWWEAVGHAVKGALAAANVTADDIAAICCDTTCCTVVACDAESGKPLRPALLWMDMRSAAQARAIASVSDPARKINGGGSGPVSAEWMLPKSLWIKENEPETFQAATRICEYQDWLNFKLTGRWVASVNNVSIRWHFGSEWGGPPASLLEKIGLSDLLQKWPQEILPLAAKVGGLTKDAAEHLGLKEGTVVAQGGADAFIGILGLGVTRDGELALLTGSSHLLLGMTAAPIHGEGIWGSYSDAVIPGLGVLEGGQTSTGSVIAWLRRLVGSPPYADLNAEAEAVPPGSEGLVILDHFQGNRTPYTDAMSRGAIASVSLRHTRGHLFRAAIEAVCFGTEAILRAMRERGYSPKEISIAGGATRSDLWLQLHADISNLPLRLTKVSDACSLGSAILAAVAAGWFSDAAAAATAMVHVDRVVHPDPVRHVIYAKLMEDYLALYPALKGVNHRSVGRAHLWERRPGLEEGTGKVKIAASILAADQTDLGGEVDRVLTAGASWIHVDLSDGQLAPTLAIGIPAVASLRRKFPAAFLDCHVAAVDPGRYLDELCDAGCSQFMFHPSVLPDAASAADLCHRIRARGVRPAIALAPGDAVSDPTVLHLIREGHVDTVNVMAVFPGYGGQPFNAAVLEKIPAVLEAAAAAGRTIDVSIDGGIKAGPGGTAELARRVGATVLIAGTAVFGASNPAEAVKALAGPGA